MKNLIVLALALAALAVIALEVFANDQNIPTGPQTDAAAPIKLGLLCDHSPTPICKEPHVWLANKLAVWHTVPFDVTTSNTPQAVPTAQGTPAAEFCKICLDASTPNFDFATAGWMVDPLTGTKLTTRNGVVLVPGACTDPLPAYDGTCNAYGMVSPSAAATPAFGKLQYQ